MSNAYDVAKQCNDYLLSLELIQEYKRYESLVKENQEFSKMQDDLKRLQKEIVNKKAKGDQDVSQTIQEYEELLDRFENHPLIVNYLNLKEEVDNYLQQMNRQINMNLSIKDVD